MLECCNTQPVLCINLGELLYNRQDETKGTASAFALAFCPDTATMQIDIFLGQSQSQTGSLVLAAFR